MKRRQFLRALTAVPFLPGFARAGTPHSQLFSSPSTNPAPIVQNLSPDSAVLLWNSLDNSHPTVEWSADGVTWQAAASIQTTAFPASDTGLDFDFHQFRAELTSLSSPGHIEYRVGASRSRFFNAGRCTEPGVFLAFGDTGDASEERDRVAASMERENAALVLHTGDLAYPLATHEALLERYFTPYASLMAKAPFFPCLGNHDTAAANGKALLQLHSLPRTRGVREADHGRYYSFDWGPIHFVALDTNESLCEEPANAMLEWLDQDLAASRAFFRVVFFHHLPYPAGRHLADYFSARVRDRLLPTLDRHNVPLTLTGHEHLFKRTYPMRGGVRVADNEGTVHVTTGGGGGALYPFEPNPDVVEAGASVHHYLRIKVEGTRLKVQARDLDGQTIDQSFIAPRPIVSAASNPADYSPAVAAGSLVSLSGLHLALSKAHARVLLGGEPLPLIYASPTEIRAHLPFGVIGKTALTVETPNGSSPLSVDIQEAAPALFPTGALRPGPATLHALGLGPVDGDTAILPVFIHLNGKLHPARSARLVPDLPGVYQIDLDLPTDLQGSTLRNECEIRVQAGNFVSQRALVPVAQ